MRILVTYASKYGTTKRYAQWIAEDLACDLRDSREVNAELLKSYDILIHGGGLCAGGWVRARAGTDAPAARA